jgi:hypothetical protein
MKKAIYLLAVLLAVLSVSALPLQINDVINVTYSGTMSNTLFGDYGAIHFSSGNTWFGTLQRADSQYLEDGDNAAGNLEVEFAKHPSAAQTYSSGILTVISNIGTANINIPFVNSAVFNKFFVSDSGKLYHDPNLQNQYCIADSDCDDGNAATVDTCISKWTGQSYCASGSANLEGTVYDTNTGLPIPGVNISFYSNDTYALDGVDLSQSGNGSLEPKTIPDMVTDANGNYSVYLPINKIYHIVLQHSKDVVFNQHVNNSKQNNNPEMKENAGGLNFEGHIQLEGQYRNGNKYARGDTLKFVMFGVNQNPQNETASFLIERHVAGVDNGADGPLVYNGSFSNPAQVLTVPANGPRTSKIIEVKIPDFELNGRYDVHVLYNNSGTLEKWHKIGNFFIVNRTQPPDLEVSFTPSVTTANAANYVNQTFNASFKVRVEPEPDSIADKLYYITLEQSCLTGPEGDELTFDFPGGYIYFNGSQYFEKFSINVTNAFAIGCHFNGEFMHPISKRHLINVTFKERYSGMNAYGYINATVWATEQQARDIYFDITNYDLGIRPANKQPNFTGYYNGDHCGGTGGYCADSFEDVNRTNAMAYAFAQVDQMSLSMGFEYRSIEDGYDVGSFTYPAGSPAPCQSEPEVNGIGVTACEKVSLTNQWQGLTADYILVLDPMTTDDLANEVNDFAYYIVVQNGRSP